MTVSGMYDICNDSTCGGHLKSDMGFLFCSSCGKAQSQQLDTANTAFAQSHAVLKNTYSRKNRFEKKLLAALRCRVEYNIDEALLTFLQKHVHQIKSPQDLLEFISRYPMKKGKRRPYLYVAFYWQALGKALPLISERDLFCLKHDFDNIYFAWERLNIEPPMFPYAFLLRHIVAYGGTRYTKNMHQLCQFVRVLRCPMRTKRYKELFHRCVHFKYDKMFQEVVNGGKNRRH